MSQRPYLVIFDILLPRLSGFEILERLSWVPAENGSAAPFIVLTALDDRDAVLKGRRLGADDYVTKPVDFDILSRSSRAGLRLPDASNRHRHQFFPPASWKY